MKEVQIVNTVTFTDEEKRSLNCSGLRIVKSAQQVQQEEEAKIINFRKERAKLRREAPLRNNQLRNALREFKKAA